MDFTTRIESLFQEYERQRSSLGEMQQKMRAISATATSQRREVAVTVGQNGVLTDVQFPTSAYKRMTPQNSVRCCWPPTPTPRSRPWPGHGGAQAVPPGRDGRGRAGPWQRRTRGLLPRRSPHGHQCARDARHSPGAAMTQSNAQIYVDPDGVTTTGARYGEHART